MSVASLAGYLSNIGGGGQQSSYYKAYNIPNATEYLSDEDQFEILSNDTNI